LITQGLPNMQNVEDLTDEIISREGGFVNDPDDPGGATKYGITRAALERYRRSSGDGRPVTAWSVADLGRSEAKAIYLRDYYERPRIGLLPESLRATVYDMYVNAGRNALVLLQDLLTQMGETVAVDGVIGPATAAAAAKAAEAAPGHLADAYGIARRNYYYALGDRRPASRKYAMRRDGGKGGWITRAETFISPRYHLSEAAHAARVAAWG
jgi:lysozyme family protein